MSIHSSDSDRYVNMLLALHKHSKGERKSCSRMHLKRKRRGEGKGEEGAFFCRPVRFVLVLALCEDSLPVGWCSVCGMGECDTGTVAQKERMRGREGGGKEGGRVEGGNFGLDIHLSIVPNGFELVWCRS